MLRKYSRERSKVKKGNGEILSVNEVISISVLVNYLSFLRKILTLLKPSELLSDILPDLITIMLIKNIEMSVSMVPSVNYIWNLPLDTESEERTSLSLESPSSRKRPNAEEDPPCNSSTAKLSSHNCTNKTVPKKDNTTV